MIYKVVILENALFRKDVSQSVRYLLWCHIVGILMVLHYIFLWKDTYFHFRWVSTMRKLTKAASKQNLPGCMNGTLVKSRHNLVCGLKEPSSENDVSKLP